jgi:hypothetical protein
MISTTSPIGRDLSTRAQAEKNAVKTRQIVTTTRAVSETDDISRWRKHLPVGPPS